MERIERIKESLKALNSIIILSMEESSQKQLALANLNTLDKEIAELEKIQNYTKISTTSTEEEPQKEMVNHPPHYKNGNIECIEAMIDVFGKHKVAAFCELNAFKYQWRANNKGTDIQDKKKAIWYLNKYIELNKGEL